MLPVVTSYSRLKALTLLTHPKLLFPRCWKPYSCKRHFWKSLTPSPFFFFFFALLATIDHYLHSETFSFVSLSDTSLHSLVFPSFADSSFTAQEGNSQEGHVYEGSEESPWRRRVSGFAGCAWPSTMPAENGHFSGFDPVPSLTLHFCADEFTHAEAFTDHLIQNHRPRDPTSHGYLQLTIPQAPQTQHVSPGRHHLRSGDHLLFHCSQWGMWHQCLSTCSS